MSTGPSTKPPSHVIVKWTGEHRFDTGRPGGPVATVDGSGNAAQSPPDLLLSALASCSAIDLLDVLAKRRTPATSLTVDIVAHRRDDPPRRFEKIVLTFNLEGEGIERVHAERGLQLAFEKYCSVAASLGPDIEVYTVVVLRGEADDPVKQPIFAPATT